MRMQPRFGVNAEEIPPNVIEEASNLAALRVRTVPKGSLTGDWKLQCPASYSCRDYFKGPSVIAASAEFIFDEWSIYTAWRDEDAWLWVCQNLAVHTLCAKWRRIGGDE